LFYNPELDFHIGDEALTRGKTHEVNWLLKSGQI
jgi:hypothetical protein